MKILLTLAILLTIVALPLYAEAASKPDKPTNLRAGAANETVILRWDSADTSVTGFRVLRRIKSEHGFHVIESNTGTRDHVYADTDVQPRTTYFYTVRAINPEGVSKKSKQVKIRFVGRPLPKRPTNLTASVETGDVTLAWAAPDDDSITCYQILRRLVPSKGGLQVLIEDTGNIDTTYTDASVEAGKSYTYKIKAVNSAGVGKGSNKATIGVPE